MDQPDKTDQNYDRLWKIRSLPNMLSDTYATFYNPVGHLDVDKVIVLFKERVIFKQYIPKKHKALIYRLRNFATMTGNSYDTSVYLEKYRQNATHTMTATHARKKSLTRTVEGVNHKLYMYNFFFPPDLFDDQHTRAINF
jgi:hypothetical protein